jgi:hypothetical protein
VPEKTDEVDDELETDAPPEDEDLDEDDEDGDDAEDVPATAAGKASAVRLLDLMVEKKALALHAPKPGKDLIEAVAKAIEWPGPVAQRANKLSNAIVDSEDVDELFIDDETLGELLKRW